MPPRHNVPFILDLAGAGERLRSIMPGPNERDTRGNHAIIHWRDVGGASPTSEVGRSPDGRKPDTCLPSSHDQARIPLHAVPPVARTRPLARPAAHRLRLRARRLPRDRLVASSSSCSPRSSLGRRQRGHRCSASRCWSATMYVARGFAAGAGTAGPGRAGARRARPLQPGRARRRLVEAHPHPADRRAVLARPAATACSLLVTTLASFIVVVTWWAGALGGLTFPLWDWALPHGRDNYDLPELLGLRDTWLARVGFQLVARGRLRCSPCRRWSRGAALLEALFARACSAGVTELREQITDLEAQTGTPRGPEGRRRLGRGDRAAPARTRHPRRPAAAAGPAGDGPRPGPAAVRHRPGGGPRHRRRGARPRPGRRWTSCARCPAASRRRSWPTAACPRRWPPWPAAAPSRSSWTAAEPTAAARTRPRRTTAYFVVAEALTNVAKHSRRHRVQVTRRGSSASGLLVTVARRRRRRCAPRQGHGLAGLADRVQAAGGVLSSTARRRTAPASERTASDRRL